MHCGVRLHGQNHHIVYLKSTNWPTMNFFKFLISTIYSILYALLLQKHVQSHIPNNYKVINKNKMSCNALCPCIYTYFYSTTYLFLALMGSWALVKAQHIKFNFCCYNVQISLIMSQPTQSDIFHNKIDAKCIVVSDFIVK
jgi:hypothetical protein